MSNYCKIPNKENRFLVADARDVVNCIIYYCKSKGYLVDSINYEYKIHRLLYLIQAKCLQIYGYPAFKNKIEAWEAGTFVPDVHNTQEFSCLTLNYVHVQLADISQYKYSIDERIEFVVHLVVDEFIQICYIDITREIRKHQPFIMALRNASLFGSSVIPLESIRSFYCGG